MAVDIAKVKSQRLSTLIADHCECESCHIVDRDANRTRVGYRCPNCNAVGNGGRTYFHLGVHSIIDLMQEFFHTPSKGTNAGIDIGSHKLAVVVFFCTLVESLLENLLREIMGMQNLSNKIQERLLSDNLTSKQRVSRLFPALADDKWKDAISSAAKAHPKMGYEDALDFFIKAVSARNKFLHPPGNKWAIRHDMPPQCLRHTPTLLSLFVWLHNHYVAKLKSA